MKRDDFNPNVWTVEQQRAPLNEAVVTEMIRDALKSDKPSIMGCLIDPDTGAFLYPNLAAKNARLREVSDDRH